MESATLVLLTPIKAKHPKKTHIKIVAPATIDFDRATDIESIVDETDPLNRLSWTKHKRFPSTGKKLKYSIKADNRMAATGDLPDSGTITITLSNPPVGMAPVVTLNVDYVDEVDEP